MSMDEVEIILSRIETFQATRTLLPSNAHLDQDTNEGTSASSNINESVDDESALKAWRRDKVNQINEDLRKERNRLMTTVNTLWMEKSNLAQRVSGMGTQLEESQQTIQTHKEQLTDLNSKLQSEVQEKGMVAGRLNKAEMELQKSGDETSRIPNLVQRVSGLESELERFQHAAQVHNDEFAELNSKLQHEVHEKDRIASKLRDTKLDLQNRDDAIGRMHAAHQLEISEVRSRLTQIESALQESKNEASFLLEQKQDDDTTIAALQADCQRQTQEIAELKMKVQTQRDEVCRQEQVQEGGATQVSHLESQLQHPAQENENMNARLLLEDSPPVTAAAPRRQSTTSNAPISPLEDETMSDAHTSVEEELLPSRNASSMRITRPSECHLMDANLHLVHANLHIDVQCLYDVGTNEQKVLGPINKIPLGMRACIEKIFENAKDNPRNQLPILKRSQKNCVRNKLMKSRSTWTDEAKLEACKACYNNQRVCMRWCESHNAFLVLPVPSGIREEGSNPGMLTWYQASIAHNAKKTSQRWEYRDQ